MNKPEKPTLSHQCHISFTLKPSSNPKVSTTNISYPQILTLIFINLYIKKEERDREIERKKREGVRIQWLLEADPEPDGVNRIGKLPPVGLSPLLWPSNPIETDW